MDTIRNFTCAGASVVIAGGVEEKALEATAEEILKGDAMGVQAAFLNNTQIKIPRLLGAGNMFSADAALCAALLLDDGEGTAVSVSSNGLDAPFRVSVEPAGDTAVLTIAAKAKLSRFCDIPCVLFGGCEYYVFDEINSRQAPQTMEEFLEKSSADCVALLLTNGKTLTPFFAQKGTVIRSFSPASAAVALAFSESESSRDFYQKTYHFPKGEITVSMKRFLSEAFDAEVKACVARLG